MQGLFIVGFLWVIIKQARGKSFNETWGIVYGMVSYLKLAKLEDNYTNE
jgi:hypothetical protein